MGVPILPPPDCVQALQFGYLLLLSTNTVILFNRLLLKPYATTLQTHFFIKNKVYSLNIACVYLKTSQFYRLFVFLDYLQSGKEYDIAKNKSCIGSKYQGVFMTTST